MYKLSLNTQHEMSTVSTVINSYLEEYPDLFSSYAYILESGDIETNIKLDTMILGFKQTILFGMSRLFNKIIHLSNSAEPFYVHALLTSIYPIIKVCNAYHSFLLQLSSTISVCIQPEIDFLESMLQSLYHSIRIILPPCTSSEDRDIFKEVVHSIESRKEW